MKKLTCIKDGGLHAHLTMGNTYEILAQFHGLVQIRNDMGNLGYYKEDKFAEAVNVMHRLLAAGFGSREALELTQSKKILDEETQRLKKTAELALDRLRKINKASFDRDQYKQKCERQDVIIYQLRTELTQRQNIRCQNSFEAGQADSEDTIKKLRRDKEYATAKYDKLELACHDERKHSANMLRKYNSLIALITDFNDSQ